MRYEIKGLYGRYDYGFDLELEEPTILTGANGTGKSTILRSINAVSSGTWSALFDLPFKSLTLRFEKGRLVRMAKTKDGIKVTRGQDSVTLDSEHAIRIAELEKVWQREGIGRQMALRRAREARWAQTGRYLESHELGLEGVAEPPLLETIRRSFHVRFVTDQRLVLYGDEPRGRARRPDRPEDVRRAVKEYSDELKETMSRELARYAAESQREDRAFPQLVVEAMSSGDEIDLDQLRELMGEVSRRREDLQRVGLLEGDDSSAAQFEAESLHQANVAAVIKTFAEVTLRKFDRLEAFRRRLQLLVDFLDMHFADKKARTSDEKGLFFELDEHSIVQPTELSSGEQQMLVLAYQLLFRTNPGTLLLIDEPELSLHVGWQSSFVDDITEMGRDRGLQFLLASHAPVLIGGREDLKRSLDKPRG